MKKQLYIALLTLMPFYAHCMEKTTLPVYFKTLDGTVTTIQASNGSSLADAVQQFKDEREIQGRVMVLFDGKELNGTEQARIMIQSGNPELYKNLPFQSGVPYPGYAKDKTIKVIIRG